MPYLRFDIGLMGFFQSMAEQTRKPYLSLIPRYPRYARPRARSSASRGREPKVKHAAPSFVQAVRLRHVVTGHRFALAQRRPCASCRAARTLGVAIAHVCHSPL